MRNVGDRGPPGSNGGAVTGRAPVLLVLDFPGRRQEARISDLRLESAGFDVRYLLTSPFVRELTAPAYAAELVSRHGPFEPAPAAALAYCMAAPIAQEIAALCDTGPEPVPLVLLDGEPATPSAIDEQFEASLDHFRSQFGFLDDAGDEPLRFDAESLSNRPLECVDRMRRRLVELGAEGLRLDGGDDEEVELIAHQAADFYLDWLVHLVAAHNATWPPWHGEVLHVVSANHPGTGNWPGARATTVRRVGAGRNELLGHPDARDLVLTFLGRVRAA